MNPIIQANAIVTLLTVLAVAVMLYARNEHARR